MLSDLAFALALAVAAIACLVVASPGQPKGTPSARVFITELGASGPADIPDENGDRVDWIELTNLGAESCSLAGWRLTDGGGFDYVFPATNVAAGGFAVVAQNPAALLAKFGAAGALGPMRPDGGSGLSKYGEKILLRDATGALVDEVEYQLGFPGPPWAGPPRPGRAIPSS